MIDRPKYLNRNPALLKCKGHMTVLSCTSFSVHTVSILGIMYSNLGKIGPNNALDHWLGYFKVICNPSNPQFASNKVMKTIRSFSCKRFMVWGRDFGKTAESNPKFATPTFHIKRVLNQVHYVNFSVFGELGQLTETERDRSKCPKSLAGLLGKYFSTPHLIKYLMHSPPLKAGYHIYGEMFIIARQVMSYML